MCSNVSHILLFLITIPWRRKNVHSQYVLAQCHYEDYFWASCNSLLSVCLFPKAHCAMLNWAPLSLSLEVITCIYWRHLGHCLPSYDSGSILTCAKIQPFLPWWVSLVACNKVYRNSPKTLLKPQTCSTFIPSSLLLLLPSCDQFCMNDWRSLRILVKA